MVRPDGTAFDGLYAAGGFPLAYRSSYVASKAALKGFASTARQEVAPYGVALTTVEPGSVATGISERRTEYLADGSPFAAGYRTMLTALNADEAGTGCAEPSTRGRVRRVGARGRRR